MIDEILKYGWMKIGLQNAVSAVLDQGLRTADIYSDGMTKVGTSEMGDAVVAALVN